MTRIGRGAQLKELGERKIIHELLSLYPMHPDQLPLGDDCGGILMGSDYLLITTDSITAASHVPEGAGFWLVGWHIVAINLSDLAAKGATPLGFVIAYGLPPEFAFQSLYEMAEGIDACARALNTIFLGGDTKPNAQLTVTGTAIGIVPRSEYLPRAGARRGDLVAVTGSLGRAGCGLLSFNKSFNKDAGIRLLLEVMPRLKEGRLLGTSGAVTACMDLSDGLAISLHQLSEATGLGFCIDHGRLPIFPLSLQYASDLDSDPLDLALYSGGDYELLFTINPEHLEELTGIFAAHPVPFTVIGEVIEDPCVLQRDHTGKCAPLSKRGYEHFRQDR